MEDEDLLLIGKQFGQFFRLAERFHASIGFDGPGRLERAAYMLLGKIAAGGPTRLSALAAELCLDLSTVSRQVTALEGAGLVRRLPDERDRRASLIEATGTGVEVFARNRARWLAAMREVVGDWSPAERQEFARLFARLNTGIAARIQRQSQGQETR